METKHSLLFHFCSIFDLLTSRTEVFPIVVRYGDPLFLNSIIKYCPIMNNLGKFKEISSARFYCIIPPKGQPLKPQNFNSNC